MLLAVLTCQSATETAQRHWPSWRKHFEDIVFVTPIDSNSWVPEGIEEWKSGRDYYPDRDNPDDNLPKRTMEVLRRFLQTKHEQLVVIEYDVVIFSRPKIVHEFSGTLFQKFIHCPWVFSRQCAEKFLRIGDILLDNGVITEGWPDRHIRLICEVVRPSIQLSFNYSRNTLDQPHMIQEARCAIRDGAWAVHGLKTQEQFDALMA